MKYFTPKNFMKFYIHTKYNRSSHVQYRPNSAKQTFFCFLLFKINFFLKNGTIQCIV